LQVRRRQVRIGDPVFVSGLGRETIYRLRDKQGIAIFGDTSSAVFKEQSLEADVTVVLRLHRDLGLFEKGILIAVADSGNSIPVKIREKIFQSLFTTKPTGQGTGLGLSLSYDIVKTNGGKIGASTKEKEGTEFVIQLPVTS
jgi:signal transduction histidine kinase